MAATQQVARQAWQVFVHTTRTHLYDHMDALHSMAMGHWHSYDGNKDWPDGPVELTCVDWYFRNKHWGHWLRRSNRWATQARNKLNRLVTDLRQFCAFGFLLFRDEKDCAVDETLYLALEVTRELLGYFIDGWQVAGRYISLDDWTSLFSRDM